VRGAASRVWLHATLVPLRIIHDTTRGWSTSLANISELERVKFVMKDGKRVRSDLPARVGTN
jgi:hypothetical protein